MKIEERKDLKISNSVRMKEYDIDFGGNVLAWVRVFNNGEIEIVAAIDGDGFNIEGIAIKEKRKEEDNNL